MEHTEHSENTANAPVPLGISPDTRTLWPSLRNWTLFLAITCFIGAAIFAFFCISMLVVTMNPPRPNNYQIGPSPGLFLAMYAVFVIFLVLLGLLFFSVSNNVNRANSHGHPEHLRRLSGSTLRYFRVAGVFGILSFLFQIWWMFRLLSM